MSPLLRLEGIGVEFDVGGGWSKRRVRALSGVSLDLDRSESLAIVGESGSGKSTLARAVTRLVAPTAGRMFLDGRDVLRDEPRGPSRGYRQRVQMVFQDPFGSLNPVHTVAHHVERPLLLHGRATAATARARAIELLDLVGLPGAEYADKRPYELSGGQRQRVAIARALAPEPDVLVADEPTSMLDVSIRMDVLRLLERLRRERGLAILLITHDLAAARWLADRVMVLYAGQLMEEAPADAIGRAARHPYTRLLVAAAPRPGGDIEAPLPARSGLPRNVDPPPGCPFAERCHDAVAACATQEPPESRPAPGHRVRCHVHGGDLA